MKSDVLGDIRSMGDQRNTGILDFPLGSCLQELSSLLLSIPCHKKRLGKKNLKMDFQVVNVPLITEVPVVGTSSSMNLHVTQQG